MCNTPRPAGEVQGGVGAVRARSSWFPYLSSANLLDKFCLRRFYFARFLSMHQVIYNKTHFHFINT